MSVQPNVLGRLVTGFGDLLEPDLQDLQKMLDGWVGKLQHLQTQNNHESDLYNFPIEIWLFLLRKDNLQKDERKLFKMYMRYLNAEMKLQVDSDEVFKRRKETKLLLYTERKTATLPHGICNGKYKHVVVHGRAANITLKKREIQEGQNDLIRLSEVQSSMDKLCMMEYYRERLRLPNFPKGITLSDFLLQQPLQENLKTKLPEQHQQGHELNVEKHVEFEMTSVSNIVYNHIFILEAPVVVMSLPQEQTKPEINAFLRNSQLCVYLNETNLLQQEVRKNSFYRNYDLTGINFVDEGEVDCRGRNIARGWVVHGRAKTAGHSWQFPPVFFFKYIAKNASVWKQFVHDMDLNGQIPFRVERLLEQTLGLTQEVRSKQSTLLALISDRHETKLPQIRIMSKNKMQQLGRLRHWDQRITDMSDFKREVLNSRLKELPKQLSPLGIDSEAASSIKPRMLQRPLHLISKTKRQKSLGSQRSISFLEGARSQKHIDTTPINATSNEAVSSFLLTKEEDGGRYNNRQNHHASMVINQGEPSKPFDLYRRQSVLITSVLQRLSSLSQFQTDEQHPIARHEFMNVRLVRQADSKVKDPRQRPRYGRPRPSPRRP